ncbi:hypothetical protein LTR64_008128 [Lithohypha guttulata]|uniref:uncharacterized protein n=1 Tax=Lithohypha guttulata TaxID=1690604 RepID=UPI002DE08797|nr:hypothetical protein LTR51_008001 [Lithohypha guttulata]
MRKFLLSKLSIDSNTHRVEAVLRKQMHLGGGPTRSVLEAPVLRHNIVAQRTTTESADPITTANVDTKSTSRASDDDDDDDDTNPNRNAIHKTETAKLAQHKTLPSPPSSSDESTIIIHNPAPSNRPHTRKLTSTTIPLAIPSHIELSFHSSLLTIRLRPTTLTTSRAFPVKTLPPLLSPSLPPTIPSETFDPRTELYTSSPISTSTLLLNQNNPASDKVFEEAASRAWKVAMTPAPDLESSGDAPSAFVRVAVLRAATALVRRRRQERVRKVAFDERQARRVLAEWKGLG